MIEYKRGDILSEDIEALINTVNCVGVMGKGLALQVKNKYPENFKLYAAACKKEDVTPGRMFIFKTEFLVNPKYIINFPTKRHWKGKSKIEDIENGLKNLVSIIDAYNIKAIAIPPLGSGYGGLDWNIVKHKIEDAMRGLQGVRVVIFEPLDQKIYQNIAPIVPKMTPGRAALIELIYRYLSGLLDPFVTLLEVHKLLYFMQEAGEPLRLNFKKAVYGPYAENLRHVLNSIEGHLISGYSHGGDDPQKQIKLVPGAVEDARAFLLTNKDTQERFKKVADLVEGFETPYGLELLATTHWVVKNEDIHSIEDVIQKIYSWNERKKQFTKRQIQIAMDTLLKKNWI